MLFLVITYLFSCKEVFINKCIENIAFDLGRPLYDRPILAYVEVSCLVAETCVLFWTDFRDCFSVIVKIM